MTYQLKYEQYLKNSPKQLQKHFIIPLTNERFASCSSNRTVKIWKDDNTYECISTLQHNAQVRSILQLRGKEVLVSANNGYGVLSCGVTFWNINDYIKLHTIKGYSVDQPTHMIELSNGNVALFNNVHPYLIVIINTSSYEIMTIIQMKEYIPSCSSMFVIDERSFIFASERALLQIVNDNCLFIIISSILRKT